MSFQSSVNFVNVPQNFQVRNNVPQPQANRAPAPVTPKIAVQSIGAGPATFGAGSIVADTLVVSPVVGGTTFTLPTASQILSAFGEPLGVASIGVGTQLQLHVVNKGTSDCLLATNSVGGDGSKIAVFPPYANYTGVIGGSANNTGSVAPVGKITNFVIEFLEVSGVSGPMAQATGLYCIYA
jgi:hypothetical protein